jgi:hypothetical protein
VFRKIFGPKKDYGKFSILHNEDLHDLYRSPSKGKGKGKVIPCALTKHHAKKAYWGSGCIAPLIL